LLFRVTGLFTSGFHLVDEHVPLEMAADLAAPDATLWRVMQKWLAMDLAEHRFRPLYYPTRVLRTAAFGLSWPAWASGNAVHAAITAAALFLFGRLIGMTVPLSIGLAAWSTFGRPASVWWRLGTPETEGNALLALAWLFLALAVA